MAWKDEYHYFIHFDFSDITLITHSEVGLTAASDSNRNVVIWKNDTPGPNVEEGHIISIIINQFSSIEQMMWIHKTEYLLIREDDKIIFWNIFKNEEHESYLITEPILFAKAISIGILVVNVSGRFSLFTRQSEISSQIRSDFIFDIEEGVVIFPHIFRVVEGEWVEEEITMSWAERGVRRRFEADNDIQINGELSYFGDREIEDLTIPESFRHYFENMGTTLIRDLGPCYLIRSRTKGMLLDPGENPQVIILPDDPLVFQMNNHNYYVVRNFEEEHKIVYKYLNMIKEDLRGDILNHDIDLENTPSTFHLDKTQDPQFGRINEEGGVLWYPDYLDDYVFIDLFTGEGSIITGLGRKKHSYVQVNYDVNSLVIWDRGKNYPSGRLVQYDLVNPTDPPNILYDEEILSKRIEKEEFLTEEELEFPLIIPAWHKIELNLIGRSVQSLHHISLSQYYLMIERWSRSENAAFLEYSQETPSDRDYVLFGDLVIPLGEKTTRFENIGPEWKMHFDTGLLVYYAIDGYCYLINTYDPYLLPIYSFKSKLPYIIDFSPDVQYLVSVHFELRTTDIVTHPNSDHAEKLTTDYPYIVMSVHHFGYDQKFTRATRFPILLGSVGVDLVFDRDAVNLFYPSYTDNEEEMLLQFNLRRKKFHQINGAEAKRLWVSHSKNSPLSKLNKGEEFPVENHPEIRRDYSMRPFDIYENALVRKEDQQVISEGDLQMVYIPQKSSSDLYDLKDTVEIRLPFYYEERLKPIYINSTQINRGIKYLITLERMQKLPLHLLFTFEKLPKSKTVRRRMKIFIENLIRDQIAHTSNGIAFEHPDIEDYVTHITSRLEEIL